MTITAGSIAGIPLPGKPISNITPFTYRDGYTFLELIERFREWINTEIVPTLNENITNLVEDFYNVLSQVVLDNDATVSELLGMFDEFETRFQAIVDVINNKSGMIDVQHVMLTDDYLVNFNPAWPNNLPVIFRFVQDSVGGHTVSLPTNVSSSNFIVNSNPNSVSTIIFSPNGDGTWYVSQNGRAEIVSPIRVDVQPRGGDDTLGIQDALNRAKLDGRDVYLRDNRYRVSNLVIDYSTDDTVDMGFKAPVIRGGSKRNTIIEQIPGSTGHVLSITGGPGDSSHRGKVTGLILESFSIHGAYGGGDGVHLRSFSDVTIRDFWIEGCGRHGIGIDRQVFNIGVSDEYGYMLNIANGKIISNHGYGLACVGERAIGSALISDVASESNALGGMLVKPSSFTLSECYVGGNSGPGVTVVNAGSSYANFGFRMFGGRLEGNVGTEIDFAAGYGHSINDVVILATTGADCVKVGTGVDAVADVKIRGGFISGQKSAAGQRAIRIGGNARGTLIDNPRIESPQFADYVSDWMDVISDAGPETRIQLRGAERIHTRVVRRATADRAYDSSIQGEANRRWSVRADGYTQFGAGGASLPDTAIYRDTANRLRMEDGDSFMVEGLWNGGKLLIGSYRLWVDSGGRLRFKNGEPSSDIDGNIIGTALD